MDTIVGDHQRWKGIHRWAPWHRAVPSRLHLFGPVLAAAALAASSALFLTGIGTRGGVRPDPAVLPGICQDCNPQQATDGLFLATPPADPSVPLHPSSPTKGARPQARPAPATSSARRPSPSMSVCATPWPSPSKTKRR